MKAFKRRFLFPILAIVVSLLAFTFFIESAFTIYHRILHGRFIAIQELQASEPNSVQAEALQKLNENGATCAWADMFIPHANYLYVKKSTPPCAEDGINVDGFRGPALPIVKDAKQFTLLFGGGSVAEELLGTGAVTTIEDELNRKYKIKGFHRFKVYSTAMAGWRQPQTFLAFAMNSHRIDAFVTLDGFNEFHLLLDGKNGLPYGTLVNPFELSGLDLTPSIALVIEGKLRNWSLSDGLLQKSHAAHFLVSRIRNRLRFIASQKSLIGSRMVNSPGKLNFNIDDLASYNRFRLQHTFRQTNALAKRFGIRTLHFLQPVLFGKKAMSPSEAMIMQALKDSYPFSLGEKYRRQVDALLELQKENVSVIDLSDLYSESKETSFVDRVHLSKSAQKVLMQKIVDSIGKEWGLESKKTDESS